MSNRGGISDTQRTAQLKALRRDDPDISDVQLSCSHAALYVLEQGASVHWKRLGIEGFFYVIRRSTNPHYRFLLRNQADSAEGDFMESLDASINYEVKGDTFFYQVGEGDVRGLWFHDKSFISALVNSVEKIYRQLGLTCHGTYEQVDIQVQAPNSASGKAILEMLKKSDASPVRASPPKVEAKSEAGGTNRILDLLRNEFNQPPLAPPPPAPNDSHVNLSGMEPVSLTPQRPRPHGIPQSFIDRRLEIEQIVVSRPALRDIIRDIFASDRFIDEVVDRIVDRCS